MAWLTLFNGVVARIQNAPDHDECRAMVEELRARPELDGFEVCIEKSGGLMVYPTRKKDTVTVYSPGNGDSFDDSWVGMGALAVECPVWPVGTNAKAPTEDERRACLAAAKVVADRLGRGAGVGPLNYGFHIFCFD